MKKSLQAVSFLLVLVLGLGLATPVRAVAGNTTRISVDSGGVQGNRESYELSISANGRYVAFSSESSNLVVGDTNNVSDIFVRDRQTGITERVSIDSNGEQANDLSSAPAISADGRYVAFTSGATNLVLDDMNWQADIFVHDRQTGATNRISVASSGMEGNQNSDKPSISMDGRYVAFYSAATNLATDETKECTDIFIRDTESQTTECVLPDSVGVQANGRGNAPIISADGRYVAFASEANNLVENDTNMQPDVFIYDRQTKMILLVSVNSDGEQGNSSSAGVSMSADGRYVTFWSYANNLVSEDAYNDSDIFVRDLQTETTTLVSVSTNGVQAHGSSYSPSISADGRYVAFNSDADNLVGGDTNGVTDVFLHDRLSGITDRISVNSSGLEGNGGSGWSNLFISANGNHVAFSSDASNLVDGDTNNESDIFVYEFEDDFAYLDNTFDLDTDKPVVALAMQPDGKVIVAGEFTTLGGKSRNYIARINANDTVDDTFNPVVNDTVTALAVQPDGKIVLVGNFTIVNEQTRTYIARLNQDGSLDSSFNPSIDGPVYALIVQPDGKLIVAGGFIMLGGQSRHYIGRLNPDGSLDGSFNPMASYSISALALQDDGKILVGGSFTKIGGQTRNCIARLNADGTLDTSFSAAGGARAGDTVMTVAIQKDGKILVGGWFMKLGNQDRSFLGRLNGDGTLDTSFVLDADNGVRVLAVQADGKILVGGGFATLGGQPKTRIARINPDGSIDTSFKPEANGWVRTILLQHDGKIILGGDFTYIVPRYRGQIARISNNTVVQQNIITNSDGTFVTWSRSGAGPELSAVTFEVSKDGITFVPVGSGVRVSGGWQLNDILLPSRQDIFIRALGYYGSGDGSSIMSTTQNAFINRLFDDVLSTHWAWQYIESLYDARITGGCATNPLRYCPDKTVTRAQMAVFLEKGTRGSGFTPSPATGTRFNDVPASHWAAAWVEQLAADGITGGCGAGNYCPEDPVTRAQMAVFLLKSKYGPSYSPPAVDESTGFGDVAADYWAAAWIKQLAAEGITGGCGAGNYCPDQPVTRAQMAVFLVRTFNLP